MKQLIITMLAYGLAITTSRPQLKEQNRQTISKAGMIVSWEYHNDRISFKMTAPTQGWLAIGVNTSNILTGTYLIMGNIINGQASVVEHYTVRPGEYKPITSFGQDIQVANIEGRESDIETELNFSIPLNSNSHYRKELRRGNEYYITIAYSNHDDFQHHSTMRTSQKIKL